MSKRRRCYECCTVLASERRQYATECMDRQRPREVEVCWTCWWMLVVEGSRRIGKGQVRGTLCVTVEQREKYSKKRGERATARSAHE